jgi:uncharacterized repeat protein (TIGR04076 family)
MSFTMHKCRITVLKRTCHEDLMNEYLDKAFTNRGFCSCFEEGQTFEVDPSAASNEFSERCFWAWWSIYDDVVKVSAGGDIPGMKDKGTIVAGCRDWFRPVLFKVERMD